MDMPQINFSLGTIKLKLNPKVASQPDPTVCYAGEAPVPLNLSAIKLVNFITSHSVCDIRCIHALACMFA